MNDATREELERLLDCRRTVNLKLTFYFDQDVFEESEEVQEAIHLFESGEIDAFADACVDEFLTRIHQEFFDPPYQSSLSNIDRPLGIELESHITYD